MHTKSYLLAIYLIIYSAFECGGLVVPSCSEHDEQYCHIYFFVYRVCIRFVIPVELD